MGRTLNQILTEMPADRRAMIEARAAELIAEEMSLQDLRKAMNKTQVSVAKKLKIGQDGISRLESQADMLLSTLQRHIEALGGQLVLVAELPNRPPVRLKEIGIFAEQKMPERRRRNAKRVTA